LEEQREPKLSADIDTSLLEENSTKRHLKGDAIFDSVLL